MKQRIKLYHYLTVIINKLSWIYEKYKLKAQIFTMKGNYANPHINSISE
ncbi:hypothetical protein CU002_0280 [Enterococcus faecium]|nr:hypothetical protein [Enterococcus faecium]